MNNFTLQSYADCAAPQRYFSVKKGGKRVKKKNIFAAHHDHIPYFYSLIPEGALSSHGKIFHTTQTLILKNEYRISYSMA